MVCECTPLFDQRSKSTDHVNAAMPIMDATIAAIQDAPERKYFRSSFGTYCKVCMLCIVMYCILILQVIIQLTM
jgi:hypothetical protein